MRLSGGQYAEYMRVVRQILKKTGALNMVRAVYVLQTKYQQEIYRLPVYSHFLNHIKGLFFSYGTEKILKSEGIRCRNIVAAHERGKKPLTTKPK